MPTHPAGPSLSRSLERHNGLNLVRLCLASAVLVSHSFPIAGHAEPRFLAGWTLGEWSVAGFFCLSGYLITGSRERVSFAAYAWRRFLRIYPGLLIALLVTGFVLAPWAAHREHSSWTAAETLHYVLRNLLMHNAPFGIGTTLSTVPFRLAWNGSLWTLMYELLAYLAIGLLLTPALARRWSYGLVGFLLVLTIACGPVIDAHVNLSLYKHAIHLGAFFLAGAFLHTLGGLCKLNALGASVAVILTIVSSEVQPSNATWMALPFAYLLLWLGSVLPSVLATHDISYGVYIYAFPLQQFLTLCTGNQNPYLLMLLAFPPTVAAATLSWQLVERPALRLKRLI